MLLSLILTCQNVSAFSLNKLSDTIRNPPSQTLSEDRLLPSTNKQEGLAFLAAVFVSCSIAFTPMVVPAAFAFEDWSDELTTQKVEIVEEEPNSDDQAEGTAATAEIEEPSSSPSSSLEEETAVLVDSTTSSTTSSAADIEKPATGEEVEVSKEERQIEELEFKLGELSDAQIAWLRSH